MLAALVSCSCSGTTPRSPEPTSTTEITEMERVSHAHHGIDYIEFVVTDVAEAKSFYDLFKQE